MKPTIINAIQSLNTTYAGFSVDNGEIIAWDIAEEPTGATQPTQAEIDAEVTRLQAEYDNAQYARDRAEAYPSIADQLDKIYHSGVAGWKADIKVIKDANPKPE